MVPIPSFDASTLLAAMVNIFTGSLPTGPGFTPDMYRPANFAAVGECTGNCSGVHDPALVRTKDGTFYRFSTGGGIKIATSNSISGPWKSIGDALTNGSSIKNPGNKNLWAPDLFQLNDTWYMYYAVSTLGSQNSDIGVAESTDLSPGSWKDHGSLGVPRSQSYNLIDPNWLIENFNQQMLLSFGSFWGDIYQIEIDFPPTKVKQGATAKQLAYNGTARPDNLPGSPLEGSYQFWWTVQGQVYYYLFFSSGNCCNTKGNLAPPGEEYKIMVCRSTDPSSGFVDKNGCPCLESGGTEVLGSHDNVYAPGGQGVYYDPGLNSVILYYHYVNPKIGYDSKDFQFGWNKLDINTSGWPQVVD